MSSRAKLQMLFCSKKITTIAIYDLIHSNALKTKDNTQHCNLRKLKYMTKIQ